jgi:hypothetical protein
MTRVKLLVALLCRSGFDRHLRLEARAAATAPQSNTKINKRANQVCGIRCYRAVVAGNVAPKSCHMPRVHLAWIRSLRSIPNDDVVEVSCTMSLVALLTPLPPKKSYDEV